MFMTHNQVVAGSSHLVVYASAEGRWVCGEEGSLERNRTLTQLAEIQRNTSVFE